MFSPFFRAEFNAETWFFLEINHKPVPFLIKSVLYPDDGDLVITFYEVHTPEQAKAYKNCRILYPKAHLDQQSEEEPELVGLEGFAIYDNQGQLQGQVQAVTEQPEQLLLTLERPYQDKTFEAPCHPELITAFSRQGEWLKMSLPEGLAEI